jgi:hypothetical protein
MSLWSILRRDIRQGEAEMPNFLDARFEFPTTESAVYFN